MAIMNHEMKRQCGMPFKRSSKLHCAVMRDVKLFERIVMVYDPEKHHRRVMRWKGYACKAIAKASAVLHPLGRIGEPSEVALAICWLLDDGQAWITGQVIGIDGGLGNVQERV